MIANMGQMTSESAGCFLAAARIGRLERSMLLFENKLGQPCLFV